MSAHDDARIRPHRQYARELGTWQGENLDAEAPVPEDQQLSLTFAILYARCDAPGLDPGGIQTRLVWDMRDARSAAYLARVRRERQQENALATIAEQGFRNAAAVQDIKRRMVAAAKEMTPEPTVEMCEAALGIGKWRARWTRK